MRTPSQLETVRKRIDDVEAEILNTREALADAHDAADIDFPRKQLEQLYKKGIVLQEKETFCCKAKRQVSTACHATTWLNWLSCLHTYFMSRSQQGLRPPGEYCQPYTWCQM